MKQLFTWRGEPILDIERWAFDRGEKMVDVTFKIREIQPFKPYIIWRKEKRTMPETFWHGLRMLDRELPSKIKFREPLPPKPDDRACFSSR